jgi:ribosome-binding factor A
MAKYRSGRINEEIKKNISSIIQNKVKDPRISAMVSVTRVDVTRDLSYAKVYISIFGNDKAKKETFEALKNSEKFIRSELGHSVRIRHVPQVIIEMDKSIEHGMHINTIIQEIKEKEENDD